MKGCRGILNGCLLEIAFGLLVGAVIVVIIYLPNIVNSIHP